MDLIIRTTGTTDLTAAAVTSASDLTPLTAPEDLPQLTLGATEPVTVKFVSAASTYESWSDDPSYSMVVSLGYVTSRGTENLTDAELSTVISEGKSGNLPLTTVALVNAIDDEFLRNKRANTVQLVLQVSVTDPSGNRRVYAMLPVTVWGRVPNFTPDPDLPSAGYQCVTATAAGILSSPSNFLAVNNVTIPSGKTLTLSGELTGTPTGGTLDLSALTLSAATINANTLTAKASTDLVLNGGSSGASITLGDGTNADAIISPTGTGKIGVGTSSPLATLHAQTAQNIEAALMIGQTNVNRWKLFMAANSPDLRIADSGGTYLTLQAIGFGELGIGTTTPVAPLHIGPNANTVSSNDPGVLISRDISDASGTGSLTSAHGFVDIAAISRTGTGTGYACFDARTQYSGTSGYDHWVGLQSLPVFGSSGTLTYCYGAYHALVVNSGQVTNSYGYWVGNASGAGAVRDQIGLYVGSLTKGTVSNYAIYTDGTTPSYFGGVVTFNTTINAGGATGFHIGSITGVYRIDTAGGGFRFFTSADGDAPVSHGLLTVYGVPEYADNAAALTGGRTAGFVYRTGDALKIVH